MLRLDHRALGLTTRAAFRENGATKGLNRMRCHGQIGGAVAIGLRWAATDDVAKDEGDALGGVPPGTKSQGDHAMNAVAPAIADGLPRLIRTGGGPALSP
jgi:hypothetical protein